MEKWFWITALFLLMDLITLAIDCIFHRAFKDFKATPNGLSQKDAKDLKAPVLAFVVLETIFVVMKIAITVYFLLKGPDRYVKEKKDWPFIISVFDVWFDFAQTVIALTTAFKMDDEMQLGYVQFAKPVIELIKTIVQSTVLFFIYFEEAPYTRLIDYETDEKINGSYCKKRLSLLQCVVMIGNVINFVCSFILIIRVSKFV